MESISKTVISKWLSLSKKQMEAYFYDMGTIGFCEEMLSEQELTYLEQNESKFLKLCDILFDIYKLA